SAARTARPSTVPASFATRTHGTCSTSA
ncbi:MAG: hypothetical protein AMXMBFR13_07700, partial [Phycisphaerae bacterium]